MLALQTTWTVTIPGWHPARLNELLGRHWGSAARRKKLDKETVLLALLQASVPGARGKRRVGLEITLAPRQRAGDPDAYWKSLLDALVACRALVNDSPAWVELEPVQYRRGPARGTRITLTDL